MVSKIAVVALVAVIAVPILLGYAMNLTETTTTEYKPDKETVNVTQLLQNGVTYSNIHADYFKLNNDFSVDGKSSVLPIFNEISNVTSSYPMDYTKSDNQQWVGGERQDIYSNWSIFYEQFDYDFSLGHTNLTLHYVPDGGSDTVVGTVSDVFSFFYDGVNQHYEANSYTNAGTYVSTSGDTPITYFMIDQMAGTATATVHKYVQSTSATNFVNISQGYYFVKNDSGDNSFHINLPERTSSALLTLNLDSITDNTFRMLLSPGGHFINKRTTDGVVTWTVQSGMTPIHTLYYDPARNDNTYQIKFDFKHVKTVTDPPVGVPYKQYKVDIEFRYVGGWPTAIGVANYFNKYNVETITNRPITNPDDYMDFIALGYPTSTRTPTIRMDDAIFAGFEQRSIVNNNYDPAAFKTNPSTMIKNITRYGDSIGFADQIYQVDTGGNIVLGTHTISVNNMIMDSVPILGGFENRINGYVISTSVAPSTIDFYGTWQAEVTTDSQSANPHTTTVWNAGDFAWDGIDSNFLMAGLLTSLGVFIALGVYSRRSKASVWPLMLVAGGAAFLFLIMM